MTMTKEEFKERVSNTLSATDEPWDNFLEAVWNIHLEESLEAMLDTLPVGTVFLNHSRRGWLLSFCGQRGQRGDISYDPDTRQPSVTEAVAALVEWLRENGYAATQQPVTERNALAGLMGDPVADVDALVAAVKEGGGR